MTRYLADQNKVLGIHESGTYGYTESGVSGAAGSVFWIGEVTSNAITDNENKLENRFLGTATRSYDSLEQGPHDVTGTLTYNAQNFRLPFWAIGSVVDASGLGVSHLHGVGPINSDVWQSAFTSGTDQISAPMSFTLEDSKQAPGAQRNFIRTINGVVLNTVTVTARQGEKVTVDADYIGQSLGFTSGATTSGTGLQDTKKPYLWSSTTLTLAGSSILTAKEISLVLNQNMEAPHYLNGSRDISTPFALNRDNTLNVTLDLNSTEAAFLYNDYYKGNSEFNGVLDFNQDVTAGSQHTEFVLSGCKIVAMDIPSMSEGVNESTIEIRPKNITGSEWTSTSGTILFNPWIV